jgi:hypothetical protein
LFESTSSTAAQLRFKDATTTTLVNEPTVGCVGDSLYLRTGNALSFQLDVSGDVFIPGVYSSTSGTGTAVHVETDGQLVRSTSSLRYKDNIQDAPWGLSEVLALRPVIYTSKGGDDTRFGGLIAEEVDKAGLTDFVVYDDEDRPDALHYGQMVALLVKGQQELAQKLEDSQNEINELKRILGE